MEIQCNSSKLKLFKLCFREKNGMIYTDYEFLEEIMKNKYKLLSIGFALAGCCYIAGTINHILNTGESILSSVLLAAGCLCLAFAYYKEAKKRSIDKK